MFDSFVNVYSVFDVWYYLTHFLNAQQRAWDSKIHFRNGILIQFHEFIKMCDF